MQTAVAAALGMDHLVTYESEWVGTRSKIELSLEAVRDLPGPSRIWCPCRHERPRCAR